MSAWWVQIAKDLYSFLMLVSAFYQFFPIIKKLWMSASTSCKLFLKFNTFLIWNSKCKDASRIFSSKTLLVFSAAMLMVEVTQNMFSSLKVTFSQRMEEIGHIRPLKGCPNWLNYQVWGGEVWMFHYAWMGLIWKCGILLAYIVVLPPHATTGCRTHVSRVIPFWMDLFRVAPPTELLQPSY